jgi:hypothetical protein
MRNRITLFVLMLILCATSVFALDTIPEDIEPSDEIEYMIRMNNGDIITGFVVEFINDTEKGEGIKFETAIGIAKIYASQIVEIKTMEESYRHNHRVFLVPTAEPISDNHFAGMFEILFFYGGFGISDYVSFTFGRSLIPQIRSDEQITNFNLKLSLLSFDFEDDLAENFSLALGGNLIFLNHNNKISHIYAVGTLRLKKTTLSALMFYKTNEQAFYTLRFGQNAFDFQYPGGAFGLGMGLDTEISKRHGIHVIGELFNGNINQPSNSGITLGIRFANTSISADFGMAVFTSGGFAPFTSFVWTPF